MPGYDGTGPLGTGPGTGWGLGPCGAGRRRGGGQFRGRRFGYGAWGFGYGRFGRRPWGFGPRRFWGPFAYGWGPGGPNYEAPADEVQALREEEAYLKNELEAIQKRLSELEVSSP